jgi:hypothetical protein
MRSIMSSGSFGMRGAGPSLFCGTSAMKSMDVRYAPRSPRPQPGETAGIPPSSPSSPPKGKRGEHGGKSSNLSACQGKSRSTKHDESTTVTTCILPLRLSPAIPSQRTQLQCRETISRLSGPEAIQRHHSLSRAIPYAASKRIFLIPLPDFKCKFAHLAFQQ